MAYVPLWCKSNFSFLDGASHVEELIEEAHRLGIASLCLTDRDGVYGAVRAHVKARELGLQIIHGAEVTVEITFEQPPISLLLLAQNRRGYAQLCELITLGRRRSEKGKSRVTLPEVCTHAESIIVLWANGDARCIASLKAAFGDRLYALITRHHRAEEIAAEANIRALAAAYEIPTVAGTEVLYHSIDRRALQDVLTCIRHGVTLPTAGRLLRPNAEFYLKSPFAMQQLFADDLASLERSNAIAARCQFDLGEIRYRYPSEAMPDGMTSAAWLRQLTFAGAKKRCGGRDELPPKLIDQLEKELQLINDLDYCGYFLTMYEIVQFCDREKILCQGRGSAANSAVCYCLGITAVDPIRMNLLFERFLSKERAEPPDIDLDIEHERREEVIQYMYKKYGRARAAMVANVIRYRARSAIRDVGKALGLPETGLDRMAKLIDHFTIIDEELLNGNQHEHGNQHDSKSHLLRLATEILNFPRHLSIHPGGFLLGHENVSQLVPIENGTMADRTVIQWDKDDVEAIGLFKVDLLGLGALTHLHRCFTLLKQHRDVDLSLATIPDDDIPTYDAICHADTVGVFQIESRAQMSMLPRLKPRTYYDIVIQVSIVRPGPITGGMVHPYLQRRANPALIDYPHEILQPVLERTLGVPLFQEQVMALAIAAADYTPGEADQLRRDMAAWRRTGQIEKHRERLVTRMQQKGIAIEFAERVFKQIQGFGEYGFPESHAASFAIISYAGSYLKCHYPVEFACSLLNSQPMGFYSPSTIIEDAKRHSVIVRPIDVQVSAWDCSLEPSVANSSADPFALRMGLRYVKGLRERDGQAIVAAAPFSSIEDLVRRVSLGENVLAALAECGAFEAIDKSRRESLWKSSGLVRARPTALAVDSEADTHFLPLTPLEVINWDYRRSHHSTRGHPLSALRQKLAAQHLPTATQIANMQCTGKAVRYAGIVICRQHPGTAAGVTFLTLEDETGFVNVVLWKQVFDTYGVIARTQSFLGVTGKLQREEGVVHLIGESLWVPAISDDIVAATSRDFH